MHQRAAELIASLDLSPHPEGGYFRKVYHSDQPVQPGDGRPQRMGLSTIYFLLIAGDASHWHRVLSDEVWHHYEGAPVETFVADPRFDAVARHVLGTVDDGMRPVNVVPARHWQASHTTGEYSLVGCSVGPAFEYEDFELLRDRPEHAEHARRRHPELAYLI